MWSDWQAALESPVFVGIVVAAFLSVGFVWAVRGERRAFRRGMLRRYYAFELTTEENYFVCVDQDRRQLYRRYSELMATSIGTYFVQQAFGVVDASDAEAAICEVQAGDWQFESATSWELFDAANR